MKIEISRISRFLEDIHFWQKIDVYFYKEEEEEYKKALFRNGLRTYFIYNVEMFLTSEERDIIAATLNIKDSKFKKQANTIIKYHINYE